ncbi:hypothetical protein BGW41_001010 [Actinomortierella wolfii]|nr:hypothetical protein BGW41_001010 [Actinomortierella wolfii]
MSRGDQYPSHHHHQQQHQHIREAAFGSEHAPVPPPASHHHHPHHPHRSYSPTPGGSGGGATTPGGARPSSYYQHTPGNEAHGSAVGAPASVHHLPYHTQHRQSVDSPPMPKDAALYHRHDSPPPSSSRMHPSSVVAHPGTAQAPPPPPAVAAEAAESMNILRSRDRDTEREGRARHEQTYARGILHNSQQRHSIDDHYAYQQKQQQLSHNHMARGDADMAHSHASQIPEMHYNASHTQDRYARESQPPPSSMTPLHTRSPHAHYPRYPSDYAASAHEDVAQRGQKETADPQESYRKEELERHSVSAAAAQTMRDSWQHAASHTAQTVQPPPQSTEKHHYHSSTYYPAADHARLDHDTRSAMHPPPPPQTSQAQSSHDGRPMPATSSSTKDGRPYDPYQESMARHRGPEAEERPEISQESLAYKGIPPDSSYYAERGPLTGRPNPDVDGARHGHTGHLQLHHVQQSAPPHPLSAEHARHHPSQESSASYYERYPNARYVDSRYAASSARDSKDVIHDGAYGRHASAYPPPEYYADHSARQEAGSQHRVHVYREQSMRDHTPSQWTQSARMPMEVEVQETEYGARMPYRADAMPVHPGYSSGPPPVKPPMPTDEVVDDTSALRPPTPDPAVIRKRGRRPKSRAEMEDGAFVSEPIAASADSEAAATGSVSGAAGSSATTMTAPVSRGSTPVASSASASVSSAPAGNTEVVKKKRGRKPKTDEDREAERRMAVYRPWSVMTPESHRRSISHTVEADSERTVIQNSNKKEADRSAGMQTQQQPSSTHVGSVQDHEAANLGSWNKADAPNPSGQYSPVEERPMPRGMESVIDRVLPPPPPSDQTASHRRLLSSESAPSEHGASAPHQLQQLDHPSHPYYADSYPDSQRAYDQRHYDPVTTRRSDVMKHDNTTSLTMRPRFSMDWSRADGQVATPGEPSLHAPSATAHEGKAPFGSMDVEAEGLESVVASTLVNIRHEKPGAFPMREAKEEPVHAMDSRVGTSQHQQHSRMLSQKDGEPEQSTSHLAEEEQETVMILQDMMNQRQAHKEPASVAVPAPEAIKDHTSTRSNSDLMRDRANVTYATAPPRNGVHRSVDDHSMYHREMSGHDPHLHNDPHYQPSPAYNRPRQTYMSAFDPHQSADYEHPRDANYKPPPHAWISKPDHAQDSSMSMDVDTPSKPFASPAEGPSSEPQTQAGPVHSKDYPLTSAVPEGEDVVDDLDVARKDRANGVGTGSGISTAKTSTGRKSKAATKSATTVPMPSPSNLAKRVRGIKEEEDGLMASSSGISAHPPYLGPSSNPNPDGSRRLFGSGMILVTKPSLESFQDTMATTVGTTTIPTTPVHLKPVVNGANSSMDVSSTNTRGNGTVTSGSESGILGLRKKRSRLITDASEDAGTTAPLSLSSSSVNSSSTVVASSSTTIKFASTLDGNTTTTTTAATTESHEPPKKILLGTRRSCNPCKADLLVESWTNQAREAEAAAAAASDKAQQQTAAAASSATTGNTTDVSSVAAGSSSSGMNSAENGTGSSKPRKEKRLKIREIDARQPQRSVTTSPTTKSESTLTGSSLLSSSSNAVDGKGGPTTPTTATGAAGANASAKSSDKKVKSRKALKGGSDKASLKRKKAGSKKVPEDDGEGDVLDEGERGASGHAPPGHASDSEGDDREGDDEDEDDEDEDEEEKSRETSVVDTSALQEKGDDNKDEDNSGDEEHEDGVGGGDESRSSSNKKGGAVDKSRRGAANGSSKTGGDGGSGSSGQGGSHQKGRRKATGKDSRADEALSDPEEDDNSDDDDDSQDEDDREDVIKREDLGDDGRVPDDAADPNGSTRKAANAKTSSSASGAANTKKRQRKADADVGDTDDNAADKDEDGSTTAAGGADADEPKGKKRKRKTEGGSKKKAADDEKDGSSNASMEEDPLQLQGREWVRRLDMPMEAWEEAFRTYERVKRLKEMKNRQPVRKRDAILAAILYIVCRDQGAPRTFSEICTASGVKRGDIGGYYRLMLKVLEPSTSSVGARVTDAEAFMKRWCESLALPMPVREAAVHVFSLANTLNLTSGKCPSSVGAAAIYLCIFSWNETRRLARCARYSCSGCQSLTAHPGAEKDELMIRKEHKDVAVAVGVVSATLLGCFRNLAPEKDRLIPESMLKAAVEGI